MQHSPIHLSPARNAHVNHDAPPAGGFGNPVPPPPPLPPGEQLPPPQPPVEDGESITRCPLPTYWTIQPRLWFAQVEAAFEANGVRLDRNKYNLVVINLPQEVAQEVPDIILGPPAFNRYPVLRGAVLPWLAASADTQLHQVLNEVRLEHRTPSQLLRYMKRLANGAISDEALKVKWLDLLPPYTSRLCRVLPATSLDELAGLADLAMPSDASVHAVTSRQSSAPSSGVSSGTSSPLPEHELTSLRLSMAQLLTAIQRQTMLLEQLVNNNSNNNNNVGRASRARSRSRSRPVQLSNAPAPAAENSVC